MAMDPKPELDPDAYVAAEEEVSDLIASRETAVADGYDEMSRDELLVRARDWRQVGNDRTSEIVRLNKALEAERTINAASGCPDCGVHAGCAEIVAERDRLRADRDDWRNVADDFSAELADTKAERDRLRAVVEALKTVAFTATINFYFSVAVPERADWPLDGCDVLIATLRRPGVISEDALKQWALDIGERHAVGLGTHLHHGDFVVTGDPDLVQERGIMPEHADCPDCKAGLARALDALEDDPNIVLIVGQLHWSPVAAGGVPEGSAGTGTEPGEIAPPAVEIVTLNGSVFDMLNQVADAEEGDR